MWASQVAACALSQHDSRSLTGRMQKLSICLRHELRRPITSFLLYVIGQRVMGLVKNQREEKQKWRVHTEREGSDSNRLWKLSLNRYSIDICGINRRMTYQKVHTWSEAEWKRREIQVSWHLSLCCWVSVEGWRHWSSSSWIQLLAPPQSISHWERYRIFLYLSYSI